MKSTTKIAAAIVACAALGACSGHKEPTGQVAATLDGKEVTVIDVRNELNGFAAPDPQTQRQAERRALDQVLARKALADAARKAKIDKSPDYVQQKDRMDENLLVQVWEKKIADSVPTPSRDEAERYVSAHPEMYANRKLLSVDQVRFPRPTDPTFADKLKAANTLEDVKQLVSQAGMPSQTTTETLDPLAIGPDATAQIMRLPPGEVFITPAGNALSANHISGSKDAPFVGDAAIKHATQVLRAQRQREAVNRQFGGILQQAKPKILYNKAYQPPGAPAAGKPATKAP